ncbi:MAG: hypothetical protein AAFW98_05560 [Pseudomonadota bacterium]
MVRISFVLILVLMSTDALAGAWTLERGKTHTYTTSSFTYGNHSYDENGDLVKVPEYRKFTLNAALEYGVRDWLTAIVRGELRQEIGHGEIYRLPYRDPIFVEGEDGDGIVYGERSEVFGAIEGAARVRLLKGDNHVVSAQGAFASGGFDYDGAGADSDGPYVEARALFGIGKPIWGRHTFFDAQAAYRFRFDPDDTDEVVVDLTVGAQLLPRWMLLGQTFSTIEVDGETHYTKAGGSVVYAVNERLRVELGGIATVYGRNALQEYGGKVGFWWTY